MQDLESEILNVFRKNPKEYSTTELAKEIFKEYAVIDTLLQSNDKQVIKNAKDQKFKLHRKLLYYLNKLVDERILSITKILDKGEKVFSLSIDEGNITIEKGYKKITITKPASTTNHIENYEKLGIMKKFNEKDSIIKLNSVMIEANENNAEKTYKIVRDIFSCVNDSIAINDFQKLIKSNYEEYLYKLSQNTLDLDLTLSLIINFDNINTESFLDFVKKYAVLSPKRINVIFNTNSKEIQRNYSIWQSIIKEFSEKKIKINIKNKEIYTAPIFIGRAGMYSFGEEEYSAYMKFVKGKTIGISCSHASIAVNINKFFEILKTESEFRNAMIKASKVLLSINAIQRRKANEYFKNINIYNGQNTIDFYRFNSNYIRLWNYDWHKDIKDNEERLSLLKSTKEVVDNFCASEETIFKSCGIPIRFKVKFSSAFKHFDEKFMGEREYKKTTVKELNDYISGEIKDFINVREELFELFDGCDRLRIFRSQDVTEQELIKEIIYVMNNFKIPFFTYDFSQLRGVVRLTDFI
ncbi:MAG: hypothetical protein QXL18_04780, partial [Candidatus Woesearchaeota archaeon]